MLTALPAEETRASLYQRTDLIRSRKGTGLPTGLRLQRRLGKGSNNRVHLCITKRGDSYVYREPRSNSDTRRVGNATWEYRNSALAMHIGAGPTLYDAWYARRRTSKQAAGLHMVMEYFPQDVHSLLFDTPQLSMELAPSIREQCITHLRAMAEHGLFCYDLKPANMIYRRLDGATPIELKFIDFGRDFSEWRPYQIPYEFLERAPVSSYLQSLLEDEPAAAEVYAQVSYAVMVVILSAHISHCIEEERDEMGLSRAERCQLNFLAGEAFELRKRTKGKHVKLIKKVLRHEEVRTTMQHYMGKRNASTRSLFEAAQFMRV